MPPAAPALGLMQATCGCSIAACNRVTRVGSASDCVRCQGATALDAASGNLDSRLCQPLPALTVQQPISRIPLLGSVIKLETRSQEVVEHRGCVQSWPCSAGGRRGRSAGRRSDGWSRCTRQHAACAPAAAPPFGPLSTAVPPVVPVCPTEAPPGPEGASGSTVGGGAEESPLPSLAADGRCSSALLPPVCFAAAYGAQGFPLEQAEVCSRSRES